MGSNSSLKFDKIDKKIITLLQKDSTLTHDEIAERIGRSQPTIGIRLRKLLKSGEFHIQPGINFKSVDLHMARLRLVADMPEKLFDISQFCPYVLNCFLMNGDFNVFLFIVSTHLEDIDSIVNEHYRKSKWIKKVEMEIVLDIAKDLILPMKFEQQEDHSPSDPNTCIKKCPFCNSEPLTP
ncbi:MAG: winged helix-turn-helix transcriptional regulator [Candidatus Lokiarchaeota archaeon]|nr:winged helix-turn-helix transcriptional regulator [Candidatus Lokiarchaeota archaeon]